ncbi:hypothetical protein [Nitratireductor sp. GCM10026969]|uniref:hypothetical protein n=1 Tax=Nitratireductor sp. GCM10026969 TaxID=3252645 RepID=UPI00366D65FA
MTELSGSIGDGTLAPAAEAQNPERFAYVVRLRPDLDIPEVVRLIDYVHAFGTGDARGHAVDGGWSLRLTELSDLRLLATYVPELIESHEAAAALPAAASHPFRQERGRP